MNPHVALVVDQGFAEARRLGMPTLLVGHLALGVARFGWGHSGIDARQLRSSMRDGRAEQWLMQPAERLIAASNDAEPDWFFAEVLKAEPGKYTGVGAGRGPAGSDTPARADPGLPRPTLEASLAGLDALVGLDTVKSTVKELVHVHHLNAAREMHGLPVVPTSLHLVLTGNPGTGKTTVARIMADVYAALGLLPSGTLVEVHRSDLVAEYVGHTAGLVEDVVESAIGGVLFIDEAYALAGRSASDFGHEAIATLVKLMEDQRDEFAVIVAGYRADMERFVASNAGLRSRFQRFIEFPDYGERELTTIFLNLARQYQISVEPAVEQQLRKVIATADSDVRNGNARSIRNLFEETYARMAVRVGLADTPDQTKRSAFDASDIPELSAADSPVPGYV